MPYTGPDDKSLPDNVQALSEEKRAQWAAIWNDVFSRCEADDGEDCEGKAFTQANGVIFQQEQYSCECIECGRQIETEEHCADIQCSACGGTMRRKDRPGQGQIKIATNRISADLVRRENVDGVEYLVAPAILFREGVWNNELVTAEELSDHFTAWNGRPIVVPHPEMDGVKVTANDPHIQAMFAIGTVYNATFDAGTLRGDLWFDVKKAQSVDSGKSVIANLKTGKPMDNSTAYTRDLEMTSGKHNGESYNGIARNLHPDHLAILLDERGACNWQDGCGVPRVNQEEAVNEESIDEQVQNQEGSMETNQTETNPVAGDGWLRRAVQTIANTIGVNLKEAVMSAEEMVAAILESDMDFTEEELTALPEKVLVKLAGMLVSADNAEEEEVVEDEMVEEEEEVVVEESAVETNQHNDDELVALRADIDALKAQLAANVVEKRKPLVADIVANSDLTAVHLAILDEDTLKALRQSVVPADYSGQGGGAMAANTSVAEALAMPQMFGGD